MEHSALSREPPEITIRTHKSEITYARARGDPLGGADAQVHAPHAGARFHYSFTAGMVGGVDMARFLMTCLFKSGGRNWGRSQHIDVTAPNPAAVGRPITNRFDLSGGMFCRTPGCNYR